MYVKSLVAVSKKSGRGWGKIRVALLRCDSERSAGYLPPQKEGWYVPRGRGGITLYYSLILIVEGRNYWVIIKILKLSSIDWLIRYGVLLLGLV